jgi:hypothetical protein
MAALSLFALQIFFLIVSVWLLMIGSLNAGRFYIVASLVINIVCVLTISIKAISLLRSGHTRRAFEFSLLTLPVCLIVQVFFSIFARALS